MANQPKKYKKFVATAATATLVASAIVPVASAASLSDIKGNTHEEAITSLVDAGVINGYPDGTFQPNKTLTRSDVVKLLGKYLVSKGLEVPADYKTNVRFNDLTSASNDELLKYAAVVYDAGVFSGSNGNLLAGDNITRENMAVVLVRAFDTLNNIDLVSYVQGQDYKKDVKDLFTAKSEARSAIEVLDFFDITNPSVANFNPKGSTTRGQFATFLYKTINTDFSAVTGVANSAVSEIKAINNTTVEVTFKEAVENIESLDFTIEGLEVKNAVVKQTNAKTVVLTTAAQTGDTVYTLNVNAAKAGTFKGVSAVIPTAVTMTTQSVQGKLGQQVTVKAQVTVAEGQSKAGIPVTFSVPGNNNDAVYPTVTGEAVTNAEGVATFTYTRYGAGSDAVTAYATGDRSKFAIGYVFWGVEQILTITEVSEGATINNGANKTYKVTYKNPTTGKPEANVALNVGVLENMNVTADKTKNVTVNGTAVKQLSNNTNTAAARITTDSKGEATFTVSGTNAEVTPVVFAANDVKNSDNTVTADYKYDASDLQTTAAKVKFGAVQADYKIEITREGGEVAAIRSTNGREYKVIVKDKDGNLAKNEIVNIAFNENEDRVISTVTSAQFIDEETETYIGTKTTVKTNDKGEATFIIGSDKVNDYATPVAWIDINTADAKDGTLDEGEPKFVAPISYFQDAYLDGSAIKSFKSTNLNKAETKFDGGDIAVFQAELVNQSGKKMPGTEVKKVTYTVFNTGANDIKVAGKIISPNRSLTFSEVELGSTSLYVESVDAKTTSVKVIATGIAKNTDGKDYAFTSKEATATFTSTTEVPNNYTGVIEAINTSKQELKFAGKKAVSIKDAKFYGQNGAELANFDAFVTELKVAAANNQGAVATYLKDSEGKVTVKIVRTSGDAPVKFDEKTTTLATAAITKQPAVGTPTTPATATVSFTDIDAVGNEIVVNGQTYKFATVAGPTETAYFQNVTDLVTKINAANGDVTAAVVGGNIALTGKTDGTEFTFTVNGTDITTTNGVEGVIGNAQQLTLTFSSALNVAVGDAVAINGTTATVKSFNTAKTSIVIELDAGKTPFVSGTTVNAITIGTNNAITVPTSNVVRIVNQF